MLIISITQLGLKEHDEKQLYMARQHLFDLRNIYAVLTDILHKNIVKVRQIAAVALVIVLTSI